MNKLAMSKGQKAILWVVFAIFLLYAITILTPLVFVLFNSIKTNAEMFENIWALPAFPLFSNYVEAFTLSVNGTTVFGMMMNSVGLTYVLTVLGTILTTVTAYVMANGVFPGKKLISDLLLVMSVVPIIGTSTAFYRLVNQLGLYNNYFGYIISHLGAFGAGYLMLLAAFKGLSWSYAEAAELDGANEWTIMFEIMIPMVMPVVLSIGTLNLLALWNDYLGPYMYYPSLVTLSVGLYNVNTMMTYQVNYPILFSTVVISILPVIMVFLLAEDKLFSCLTLGGLKG